ncbi:uncharacterized protein LOC132022171 [Mustela nigripes]|uniref:uncharacterized protein LOC132022171 n=1 Tax=Mustela nigripes TaxID=77151 RepID=UPI0028167283|nr:uncharacterized protein LOC132022171 [Mustela nigripes]
MGVLVWVVRRKPGLLPDPFRKPVTLRVTDSRDRGPRYDLASGRTAAEMRDKPPCRWGCRSGAEPQSPWPTAPKAPSRAAGQVVTPAPRGEGPVAGTRCLGHLAQILPGTPLGGPEGPSAVQHLLPPRRKSGTSASSLRRFRLPGTRCLGRVSTGTGRHPAPPSGFPPSPCRVSALLCPTPDPQPPGRDASQARGRGPGRGILVGACVCEDVHAGPSCSHAAGLCGPRAELHRAAVSFAPANVDGAPPEAPGAGGHCPSPQRNTGPVADGARVFLRKDSPRGRAAIRGKVAAGQPLLGLSGSAASLQTCAPSQRRPVLTAQEVPGSWSCSGSCGPRRRAEVSTVTRLRGRAGSGSCAFDPIASDSQESCRNTARHLLGARLPVAT